LDHTETCKIAFASKWQVEAGEGLRTLQRAAVVQERVRKLSDQFRVLGALSREKTPEETETASIIHLVYIKSNILLLL